MQCSMVKINICFCIVQAVASVEPNPHWSRITSGLCGIFLYQNCQAHPLNRLGSGVKSHMTNGTSQIDFLVFAD